MKEAKKYEEVDGEKNKETNLAVNLNGEGIKSRRSFRQKHPKSLVTAMLECRKGRTVTQMRGRQAQQSVFTMPTVNPPGRTR